MFSCETCGKTFDVRREVLDRYPGWVPRQCLDCRNAAVGDTPTGATQGRTRTPSVSKTRDLTLAEVLDRFSEGPDTGVFTDGASEGNPGPGGWGAVMVVDGEIITQARGAEPHTTNNRMELTALVAGLRMIEPDGVVDVYTDSQLVANTINQWAGGWEQRGWRRKTGAIANLELVKEAYHLARQRPGARIMWIPAHSGFRWNEYADALATAYRRERL